jgi:hypothetical protein
MRHPFPNKPFRWNIAKREQLGALPDVKAAETFPGFADEVRRAAALVVARAGDSDLVFVGRSPECLFDYLSGVFEGVEDAPTLTHMNFSAPYAPPEEIARTNPTELAGLFEYFRAERLDPKSIATAGKQVRFVDVVASGTTFRTIVSYLRYWSHEQRADWNVVQRRFGFVGLTFQTETSPKTRRWWQNKDWVAEVPKTPITNVSLPGDFWRYIANADVKVTPSHWLDAWASPDAQVPVRNLHLLQGLRLALETYDRGRDKHERERLVREITRLPEMREGWLRSLVLRLRRAG